MIQLKLPPTHIPKRKCRCGDCRSEIDAMTTCYRLRGQNICESCGTRYRWNAASNRWELGTDPVAIAVAKPRMGRPPLGESACEVRWFAKATHEEEAVLVALAKQFAGGNKSELLRLAVRRMSETI